MATNQQNPKIHKIKNLNFNEKKIYRTVCSGDPFKNPEGPLSTVVDSKLNFIENKINNLKDSLVIIQSAVSPKRKDSNTSIINHRLTKVEKKIEELTILIKQKFDVNPITISPRRKKSRDLSQQCGFFECNNVPSEFLVFLDLLINCVNKDVRWINCSRLENQIISSFDYDFSYFLTDILEGEELMLIRLYGRVNYEYLEHTLLNSIDCYFRTPGNIHSYCSSISQTLIEEFVHFIFHQAEGSPLYSTPPSTPPSLTLRPDAREIEEQIDILGLGALSKGVGLDDRTYDFMKEIFENNTINLEHKIEQDQADKIFNQLSEGVKLQFPNEFMDFLNPSSDASLHKLIEKITQKFSVTTMASTAYNKMKDVTRTIFNSKGNLLYAVGVLCFIILMCRNSSRYWNMFKALMATCSDFFFGDSWSSEIKTTIDEATAQGIHEQSGDFILDTGIFTKLAGLLIGGSIFNDLKPGNFMKGFLNSCKDFKRKQEGVADFTKFALELIARLINYVTGLFGNKKWVMLRTFGNSEFWEWHENVAALKMAFHEDKLIVNYDFVVNLRTLYKEGERLMKEVSKSDREVLDLIKFHLNSLKPIMDHTRGMQMSDNGFRPEPIGIMLGGIPGVGKTSFFQSMCATIAFRISTPEQRKKFLKDPEAAFYNRVTEQEFWDNYKGQPVCLFDDFGQLVDMIGMSNSIYWEWIRAVNTNPWSLHMADLIDKGNTPFSSRVVIGTTNLTKFEKDAEIKAVFSAEAVTRRIKVGLWATVTKDYAIDEEENPKLRKVNHVKMNRPHDSSFSHLVFFHHNFATGETKWDEPFDYHQIVEQCVDHCAEREKYYAESSNNLKNLMQELHAQFSDNETTIPIPTSTTIAQQSGIDPLMSGEKTMKDLDELIASGLEPYDFSWSRELMNQRLGKPWDYDGSDEDEDDEDEDQFEEAIEDEIFLQSGIDDEKEMQPEEIRSFFSWYDVDKVLDSDELSKSFRNNFTYNEATNLHRRLVDCALDFVKTSQENPFDMAYMLGQFKRFEKSPNRWASAPYVPIGYAAVELFLDKYELRDLERVGEENTTYLVNAAFWGAYEFLGEFKRFVATDMAQDAVTNVINKISQVFNTITSYKKICSTVLVVIGAITIYRAFTKTEEQSSKAMRPQRASAGRKLKKIEQSGSDPAGDDITASLVRRNMVSLTYRFGNVTKECGSLLAVKGNLMIGPAHYLNYCAEADEIILKPYVAAGSDFYLRLTAEEFKNMAAEIEGQEDEDIAIYTIPNTYKHHQFRDISKFFLDNAYFKKIGEEKNFQTATLTTPKFQKDNKTLEVHSQIVKAVFREKEVSPTRNWSVFNKDNAPRKLSTHLHYACVNEKGYCGSILTTIDKSTKQAKILGFHVLGDTRLGYAFPMSRERIEVILASSERYAKDFPDDAYKFVTNYIAEEKCPVEIFEQGVPMSEFNGFRVLGTVKKLEHLPSRSCIVESPCKEVLEKYQPIKRFPPAMDRCVTGLKDPLQKARYKYNQPSYFYDPDVLAEINSQFLSFVVSCARDVDHAPRLLTFEEAVQGIEGDESWNGISRKSSAGWPWTSQAPKGSSGKQWIFGDSDWDLDNPNAKMMKERVNKLDQMAKEGIRPFIVAKDFPKDERRPPGKILRMISGYPVDYNIWFRIYFGDFMRMIYSGRIENGLTIGTNVYSEEWHMLTKKHKKFDKTLFGDFSNWDGNQTRQIMNCFLEAANAWYGDSHIKIREVIFEEIFNSKHIYKNTIYEMFGGMGSGNPGTAIINTWSHAILNRYALRMILKEKGYEWPKNIETYISGSYYGDDEVFSISDHLPVMPIDFQNQYKSMGWTFTDEFKSGEIGDWRKLEEGAFLKRGFHFHEILRRYAAPLSLETILEMPCFTKEKDLELEYVRSNLEKAWIELSLHPRDVFEKKVPILQEMGRAINYIPPETNYRRLAQESTRLSEIDMWL